MPSLKYVAYGLSAYHLLGTVSFIENTFQIDI